MADLNARILPLHTEVQGREPTDDVMAGLGKTPIDVGELVLNLEDRKIFSKKADGTIVTLGSGSEEDNDLLPGELVGQALVWDGESWVNGPVIGGLDSDDVSSIASFLTNMGGGADDVINGQSATYFGVARFDTGKPLFGTGSAYNPGAGSRIEWGRSNAYSLNQSAWTVEFWMFSDGTLVAGGEYILNATAGGDGNGYGWQGADGNYWSAFVGNTSTTFSYWDGAQQQDAVWSYPSVSGNSRWMHVAFQVDSSQIGLWIDGQYVGAQGYAKSGDPTGLFPRLVFGNFEEDTDGNPIFEGWLGGARIIQGTGVYTAGQDFTPPSTGFDELGDLRYSLSKLEDVSLDPLTLQDGQSLVYEQTSGTFTNKFSRIQDSGDFSLSSELPLISQWSEGDSANPGEYSVESDFWLLNVVDQTTNDRTQVVSEAPTSGILFWAVDGSNWNEVPYTGLAVNTNIRIDFGGTAPNPGTLLYLAFGTPGSPAPYPLREGDTLKWDAAEQAFKPIPLSSLGIAINDLEDVNTQTTSPTAGQALVWNDTQGVWVPGDVATNTDDIELSSLSDVTINAALIGQVLRYDGSGWTNQNLDYSSIQNTPTIPTTVAALDDTDLSIAPTVGQVLVWNGTAWSPEDQSGGGGGETTPGALTERADITNGLTLVEDASGSFEIEGLGEAGSFVEIVASQPSWVRFYPTDADRTSDIARAQDTDPLPGSGVLLEVKTTVADQVVKVTPGAIYYNNDSLPDQKLYVRITNQSGVEALCNVTVKAYTQTNTTAISGGSFGSG